MARDGSGIYSAPAGTTATAGTPIESAKYNALVSDLVSDANIARPIVAGGTGATTAAAARTALGIDTSTFQPLDPALTSISGLVTSANKMIYATGVDTYAVADLTAAGRAILDDADAAAQRATLGAQASDADLTAVAALTGTGIAVRTADNTWALRTITSTDASVTITNPGGVAGNINLSVTPASGGVTLLGTVATTSGSSQSFTSLDLTGYKMLRVVLVGVTGTGTTFTLNVGGQSVATGLAALTAARGIVDIDVTDGTYCSNVAVSGTNDSAAAQARAGDMAITSATTSIAVSVSTGNFNAGSARLYGYP